MPNGDKYMVFTDNGKRLEYVTMQDQGNNTNTFNTKRLDNTDSL